MDDRDRLAATVLRARWLPPLASYLPAGVYFSTADPSRPTRPTARRTVAAHPQPQFVAYMCILRDGSIVKPGTEEWGWVGVIYTFAADK